MNPNKPLSIHLDQETYEFLKKASGVQDGAGIGSLLTMPLFAGMFAATAMIAKMDKKRVEKGNKPYHPSQEEE